MDTNYKQINKNSWNKRTDIHFDSEFYDNKSFIDGRNSLNSIELELLGDLTGKSVLHLQCHFGQDTISLTRLGAKATGVDISDKSIKKAEDLAQMTGSDATFICCDLYDLPQYLDKEFDVIFTSYGTVAWLPDMDKWAKLLSKYLKPKGKFVFAEFHPVLWMFDDDFKEIAYDYFNTSPIVTNEGTYTDGDEGMVDEYVSWNHSISEIVTNLISNGFSINALNEYDYSPYPCFNDVVEFESGKYRLKNIKKLIPMVYAIQAEKN